MATRIVSAWATASSTNTDGTWNTWTSASSTNSTTASSDSAWLAWTGGTYVAFPASVSSEEDAARAREREREHRRHYEELRERRRTADERAKKLLQSLLTPEQVRSLEEQSSFLVESESKRLYKIRKGSCYNILEVDQNGKSIARLCTNFGGDPDALEIPDYDLMLAQKLILENNEALFLRTANRETTRL